MRPRKVVYLIDPSPDRQSITRLVLQTRGYKVLSVSTLADADRKAKCDALLVYGAFDWVALADLAHAFDALTISVGGVDADHDLPLRVSAEVLLDRVRMATIRKRGPKKNPAVSDSVQRVSAAA